MMALQCYDVLHICCFRAACSSVAFAPPLCQWDAGNNCGQMVLDAGQVRASTRFSADASGFIEWLSETPVLDLPHVFQALLK